MDNNAIMQTVCKIQQNCNPFPVKRSNINIHRTENVTGNEMRKEGKPHEKNEESFFSKTAEHCSFFMHTFFDDLRIRGE